MLTESKRLEQQIKSLQANLKNAPDGSIYSMRNEDRFKWQHQIGRNKRYLPKSERALAEQLAIKKYHSYLLKESIQKKNAIDSYLRLYKKIPQKSLNILNNPAYQELLAPYFLPKSQELQEWMNAPFESNPYYPEHLNQPTSSGIMVRSKSEALIEMLLHTNNIPFRYESILQLGDTTLYPDFTLRHPKTGKKYYWEHFGMMDVSEYRQKAANKLQTYTSHGIFPTIHLITTYETQEHPLGFMTVKKIIDDYFLD